MADPTSEDDNSNEAMMNTMMGFSSFSTSGSKARTSHNKKTAKSGNNKISFNNSPHSQLYPPRLSGSNKEPVAQRPRKHLKLNDENGSSSTTPTPVDTDNGNANTPAGLANSSLSLTPAPANPTGLLTFSSSSSSSSSSYNTALAQPDNVSTPVLNQQLSEQEQQQQQRERQRRQQELEHMEAATRDGLTITRFFRAGSYSFITPNGDVGFFSPNFIVEDPWKKIREQQQQQHRPHGPNEPN